MTELTNPLHAPFLADQAVAATVPVLLNQRVARDTFRLRFRSPEIAARTVPGQFVMLRLAGCQDPLIGRPFAVFDVTAESDGDGRAVDVVYLVKGKLTTRLTDLRPGQPIEVWGPLGNGFPVATADHLIMVAGGIGYTPFLSLAKEHLGRQRFARPGQVHRSARATFCYGARTADYLVDVGEFEAAGVRVLIATDDGSRGRRGLATDLLSPLLAESGGRRAVVCCGPEPMMAATARLAQQQGVSCQASLETPMACGIGICFTCVARVRDGRGGWDYKRTCVEGPIFDATQIDW